MKLKKSLGQHFLKDKRVTERIAQALGITEEDLVVEIGPGGGALTEELLKAGPKQLFAVELDPQWARFIKEQFPEVKVYNADAATFNFSEIPQRALFAGNLPYNVSTAILRNLLNHRKKLKRGVFMVQKEVADRLTAKKGKEFGYLPALLQQFFKIEKLFNVPPSAFVPPPKVVSTVFKVEPVEEPPLKEEEVEPFEEFLKRAFAHRRKKLKKNLPELKKRKELKEYAEKRAEELTAQELLTLFKKLKNRQ